MCSSDLGQDGCHGEGGDDELYGGPSSDQLYGGDGYDLCEGLPGIGRSHECERRDPRRSAGGRPGRVEGAAHGGLIEDQL